MTTFPEADFDELQFSPEYGEYIMDHGDRMCCNGHMLTALQEEGYLFEQFVEHLAAKLVADEQADK